MYDLPITFWKDPHTPAFVLLSMVINKYGTACFDWEPELLRKELEEDYNVTFSDLQSDKLQAAITILSTDQIEEHWEAFETCCHLLNNEPDNFETFEPLEAEEIAHALPELELIKGAELEPILYGDEVRAYAGIIFHAYGMCQPPRIFPTAIMPTSVTQCDDTEKNEALEELYNARRDFLHGLVKRVATMHE